MIIDFNMPILTPYGDEMEEGDRTILLGDVCVQALMVRMEDEKITGFEKLRRFKFSEKIVNQGHAEDDPKSLRYVTKDCSKIQRDKLCTLIEAIYSGGVYGFIYKTLHGGEIDLPEDGEDWTTDEEVELEAASAG